MGKYLLGEQKLGWSNPLQTWISPRYWSKHVFSPTSIIIQKTWFNLVRVNATCWSHWIAAIFASTLRMEFLANKFFRNSWLSASLVKMHTTMFLGASRGSRLSAKPHQSPTTLSKKGEKKNQNGTSTSIFASRYNAYSSVRSKIHKKRNALLPVPLAAIETRSFATTRILSFRSMSC